MIYSPDSPGGELLKLMAGIDVVHIPYKGTGPAMNDLIGGHVDVMFSGISSARPHIEAGTLRALAVIGGKRSPALPDCRPSRRPAWAASPHRPTGACSRPPAPRSRSSSA
ncbi:MAG TPA: tripartite tricarboxylate transporter substrate-binding protein [Bradyrhizobium sp.]